MADSSSTAAATPTKSVPPPPLVPSQQQNPQQEATNSVANTVQDKSSIAQEPVEELGLLGEQLAIIRSNLVIVVAVCVTWLAQWTFGDISASL
jgi:hypothetical protein